MSVRKVTSFPSLRIWAVSVRWQLPALAQHPGLEKAPGTPDVAGEAAQAWSLA